MGEVTELMNRARAGERGALDRLFELLYPELRQVAHRRLARHPRDGGLETTALVNECYLRLAQREGLTPADRAHFLGYAAAVMRSVNRIDGSVVSSLMRRRGLRCPRHGRRAATSAVRGRVVRRGARRPPRVGQCRRT